MEKEKGLTPEQMVARPDWLKARYKQLLSNAEKGYRERGLPSTVYVLAWERAGGSPWPYHTEEEDEVALWVFSTSVLAFVFRKRQIDKYGGVAFIDALPETILPNDEPSSTPDVAMISDIEVLVNIIIELEIDCLRLDASGANPVFIPV